MIRVVRADSGFFEDKLLRFLEQRSPKPISCSTAGSAAATAGQPVA